MLEIRSATASDLEALLSVLDDAAAWLQSIGVTEQWPPSFSGDALKLALLQRLLEDGTMFLALLNGEPAGCFHLRDVAELYDTDAGVWPPGTDDALYLFWLAVRREHAGKGVVLEMLDCARQRAAAVGKQELRLDCWGGNDRLRRYYLDAGFDDCGDVMHTERIGARRTYNVSRFALPVDRPVRR